MSWRDVYRRLAERERGEARRRGLPPLSAAKLALGVVFALLFLLAYVALMLYMMGRGEL